MSTHNIGLYVEIRNIIPDLAETLYVYLKSVDWMVNTVVETLIFL